ncbi:MAG: PEP-CTERM sorting domain-containing protein [Pseudomonadota bacterium]
MRLLTSAIAAAAMMGAAPAFATAYTWNVTNPGGSSAAGDITEFTTTYDTVEELSFEFSVNNLTGDVAWLALSDGPNPKGEAGQLALLYIDITGGDVYAYNYSGQNNGNSWQSPGDFITSWADVLTVSTNGSETTVSFTDLDVSLVQSHTPTPDDTAGDWTGVAFDDKVGIWFHIAESGGTFETDGTQITGFNPDDQSWYDTANKSTSISAGKPVEPVSEPGMIGLFGLGLLGLGFAARRRG